MTGRFPFRPHARPRLAALALALLIALPACAPRFHPPGEPAAAPRLTDDHFVAADGARLPLRRWLPDGAPEAVILALHGFNDYSGAFALPAEFWAAHGVATFAYDQRGFGEAPHRGFWPGAAALSKDAADAARALSARYPDAPLYVLGESMGGAVALVALSGDGAPEVDGAVLVAPAVWGRAAMNPLQSAMLWVAAHTVPGLELSGKSLRVSPTDNIPVLKRMAEDPLVGKGSRVDTLYGLVGLMDRALDAAPRLRPPALVLYGARDDIVPEAPVAELVARLPHDSPPRWRAAVYPRGYHMLLRDLQAENVWRDVLAWMDDRDAPLPSAADLNAERMLIDDARGR